MSVLIPTFNRPRSLLERCLPSVLAQTHKKFEVIIACHGDNEGLYRSKGDNPDKKDTWTLAIQSAPNVTEQPVISDHRIRVIEVPREETYPPTARNHWLAGPVAPLNAALEVARGDYLARIDDDDEWSPSHLTEMLRFAEEGDYEFVSSAYKVIRPDGTHHVVWTDGGDPPAGGTQTWLWRSYLRFMRWNPHCWRKSWNAVNDTDLVDRFRKAGVRMGFNNYIGTAIRVRDGENEIGLAAYLDNAEKTEDRYAFR